MKKILIAVVALLYCLTANSQTTVYENNFEVAGTQPDFDTSMTATNPTTGRYLGKFAGLTRQSATLTLTNLPPHQYITVRFNLLAGMTWDGDGRGYIDLNDLSKWGPNDGPDIFKVTADNQTKVNTTFASNDIDFYRFQSYPGTYPQDTYRPGTGAICTNCLGCKWDVDWYYAQDTNRVRLPDALLIQDALYHFDITYQNSDAQTVITWQSFGLVAATYFGIDYDEWWGLDDLTVQVSDAPLMPVTVCQPELFQKIVPNKDNTQATVYVWGEPNTILTIQSSEDLAAGQWVDVRTNNFNGYFKTTTSMLNTQPVVGPQSIGQMSDQPRNGMKLFRAKLTPKPHK